MSLKICDKDLCMRQHINLKEEFSVKKKIQNPLSNFTSKKKSKKYKKDV